MNTTYRFQYECANDAGERETLDPIRVTHVANRAAAAETARLHVHQYGGRLVRCESCSEDPLLVGEIVCHDCVGLATWLVWYSDDTGPDGVVSSFAYVDAASTNEATATVRSWGVDHAVVVLPMEYPAYERASARRHYIEAQS